MTRNGATAHIRQWTASDAGQLHHLMHKLAVFEGYDAEFHVTEHALRQSGLGPNPAFTAFVAECQITTQLVGMAVVYPINWTFDLRPTLVLKELYVDDTARDQGIGTALLAAVKHHAKTIGASRINWTVLAGNHRAEEFYRKQGGQPDKKWVPWTLKCTTTTTNGDIDGGDQ